MSLSRDLLEQAKWLAKREPKRPKQASLRRAVSTAYYALFHLLSEEVAARLAPAGRSLANHFRRALKHATMKKVAEHIEAVILKGQPPQHMMAGATITGDLGVVAIAFSGLQQARHDADYNIKRQFTRVEVLDLVAACETAFAAWLLIRKTPEADAFLSALLLWDQAPR